MKLKMKPSGVYFVETRGPDGARLRVSLDTKVPEDAAEQFRLWKINAHPKQLVEIKPRQRTAKVEGLMTLRQGLERCLNTVWAQVASQATYRSKVRVLSNSDGDTVIEQINYTWLQEFLTRQRALGRAEGTVKGSLDVVAKVLREAVEWEYPDGRKVLAEVPKLPSVNPKNEQDRVLSLAEELKVFEAIERKRLLEPARCWTRLGHLIRFLLDTGCRLSEALGAREQDIVSRAIGERRVSVYAMPRYSTKNDKPRQVPLSDAVMDSMPWLRDNSVAGKLFPMKPSQAWNMWDRVRTEVGGMDDVKLHTLRHTCATRLVVGGMDIFRVSEWLGHGDISITTKRYAHLVVTDLLTGLDILNANPASAPNSFRKKDNHSNGTSNSDSTSRADPGVVCH